VWYPSGVNDLKSLLRNLAYEYPSTLMDRQLQDIDRVAFHSSLIGDSRSACDLGGGIGLIVSLSTKANQSRLIYSDATGDCYVSRQFRFPSGLTCNERRGTCRWIKAIITVASFDDATDRGQ